MTTPRDDIAGLIERLREQAMQLSGRSIDRGCVDSGIASNLADEAADQLDALLKERFKLITDLADMKSRAISAEQERDALRARVKDQQEGMETIAKEHLELARDYDKLQARVKELEAECDIWAEASMKLDIEKMDLQDRATRLQQERDEAYERAALLDAMEQECWTLRCIDIPTGGGDADVGWEVIQHHQAKPHERVIAHGSTPKEALNAAIRRLAGPEK